ncbi:hypothetical protein AJ79_01201 [Helicocarpus griseus UAMH5409]|uniref:SnoaL-like domain-containing protein n=1 Tax=Helicocarpus griseus UAMH5409 TaxID=1447875 RepID=A0A2B7Y9N5_9EURO|nr:hypothetical protein AJ79_01201 [Helicocarpus griseus UAMH5409]
MASYQVMDYLLDRANIHDVVTKMTEHFNTQQWDKLVDEVFAENFVTDLSAYFGTPVRHLTGKETAAHWKDVVEALGGELIHIVSTCVKPPSPSTAALFLFMSAAGPNHINFQPP